MIAPKTATYVLPVWGRSGKEIFDDYVELLGDNSQVDYSQSNCFGANFISYGATSKLIRITQCFPSQTRINP